MSFDLHDYRKDHDEEIRAVHVVGDQGVIYHIGIENMGDSYVVRCYWSADKKVDRQRVEKSWERKSSLDELAGHLQEAYAITERWIAENGNTRTWVK